MTNEAVFSEPRKAVQYLKNLSAPRLMIFDCDETLFLRNSTEEYLNCIRPRALGALWLTLLEILQPWHWLPTRVRGIESKDWIRVVSATILFPWTWLIWRRKTRQLAQEYENRELTEAVAGHSGSRFVVATHGFRFIVAPLTRHFSIRVEQVLGCGFFRGIFDRQKRKEDILRQRLDQESLAESVVVTDSAADTSLLEIVKHPVLVQWPKARYIPALSDAYLPFYYLERIKRPGQSYTRWMIVETQLVILFLAYSWLSPFPPLHLLGMILLTASFWAIYETGYYENDRVAEAYEEKPALSVNYSRDLPRMSSRQPWIFAACSGLIGVTLLQLANLLSWNLPADFGRVAEKFAAANTMKMFGGWIGILVAVRLLFLAYNYLNETTRVWLFPGLQIFKYFAFLVVARTNLLGMSLLIAQIFSDWLPYLVYRCGGRRELVDEHVLRLFVFLVLAGAAGLAGVDWAFLRRWQFIAILAWLLLRSKSQLTELIKNARPVWQKTES